VSFIFISPLAWLTPSLFLLQRSVSALLFLAGTDEAKKKPPFESVLLEQVQLLRASLGDKYESADVEASGST
jgi:hypothetical protein